MNNSGEEEKVASIIQIRKLSKKQEKSGRGSKLFGITGGEPFCVKVLFEVKRARGGRTRKELNHA